MFFFVLFFIFSIFFFSLFRLFFAQLSPTIVYYNYAFDATSSFAFAHLSTKFTAVTHYSPVPSLKIFEDNSNFASSQFFFPKCYFLFPLRTVKSLFNFKLHRIASSCARQLFVVYTSDFIPVPFAFSSSYSKQLNFNNYNIGSLKYFFFVNSKVFFFE